MTLKSDRGVLRPNERLCTVWAPKLGLGKKKAFFFLFFFVLFLLGTSDKVL